MIYVDDILIYGRTQAYIDAILLYLNKYFPVKDMGPVHDFLGMEIFRDATDKSFRLHQLGLINEALDYARPVQRIQNLPMSPSFDIFASQDSGA